VVDALDVHRLARTGLGFKLSLHDARTMPRQARSVTIRATPAEVFAYVADSANAPAWAEGIVEIRETAPQPGVVGSRFEVDIKEGGRVNTYQGEALAHDPPRRKRDRLGREGFFMEMQLDVEDAPEGARLTQSVEYDLNGARVLLAPLVGAMLRRSLRKQTAAVKAHVEARA
jgi:hypothetical protein